MREMWNFILRFAGPIALVCMVGVAYNLAMSYRAHRAERSALFDAERRMMQNRIVRNTVTSLVLLGLVFLFFGLSLRSGTSIPAKEPTHIPTHTPTRTPTYTPMPTCPPDPSKYGFEEEVLWVAQTYTDTQAVTTVSRSERNTARFGCYSLKLDVDLVGGHPNQSKGEAYVDMRYFPPKEGTSPINLEGVEITVWVSVPWTAAGAPNRPNGIQVFVKDKNFNNEYGSWLNLSGIADSRWVPVKLIPGKQSPRAGYMDVGFDPTNIIIVGIKIGAGTGSSATYKGPIYVDAVDWPK